MDTLVPEIQFVEQRFPPFRVCFICISIYLDPQKQSVIERFLLAIRGVCNKRFHCM
jgi:hypothetical protein